MFAIARGVRARFRRRQRVSSLLSFKKTVASASAGRGEAAAGSPPLQTKQTQCLVGFRGTMLCFNCSNVEAVVARAERAGHCEVTVRGDRFCDCCITITAEVKDPFDNVWCFRQTVPCSGPAPPYNYQPHALFAGVIGLVHIFVQKLRLPPSEYAVVVLMLLWNKYTWAFWDALVAPKLDLGARLVGFWLIWDEMSKYGKCSA